MILLNDVVEVATAPHPYVNSLTVIVSGYSIGATGSSPNGQGSLR
jgi:hypothetical protein